MNPQEGDYGSWEQFRERIRKMRTVTFAVDGYKHPDLPWQEWAKRHFSEEELGDVDTVPYSTVVRQEAER